MWGMGIFLVIERLTPCSAQIYNMVDIGYYLADTVSHFLTPTHISLHFFCGFVWFCLILRPLTSLRASVARQQERNKDGRIHRQRRLLMLWIWRYRILAKFKLIVKKKQCQCFTGCTTYNPHCVLSFIWQGVEVLYIYISVGLMALLVSRIRAMLEAL